MSNVSICVDRDAENNPRCEDREPLLTLETPEEHCIRLCQYIWDKYNEIILLRQNIDSREIIFAKNEVRFHVCSILELTYRAGCVGLILSSLGIFYCKLLQWGYSQDRIQDSHQKIRDAEIIIAHHMDALRSLLADHPDLLDCTDLPEDLYDHCTRTIRTQYLINA